MILLPQGGDENINCDFCVQSNMQALGMARTAEVKRDARIGEGTLSNQLFVGASKQKVDSSQHNTIKGLGEAYREMYQIIFL